MLESIDDNYLREKIKFGKKKSDSRNKSDLIGIKLWKNSKRIFSDFSEIFFFRNKKIDR